MFGEDGIDLKSIFVLALVVFFIAAGTSYFILNFFTSDSGAEENGQQQVGPSYNLGDFVVNLQGAARQFLRVSIVVQVEEEEVITEIEEKTPRMEDMVNKTLRSQNLEDIEDPGTPVLKQELKNGLNRILSTGEITEIWFTEILVQ